MKYKLLQKQELDYRITKSLSQNPNINAQASDEYQLLEKSEDSSVVFVDMLLSKQASNICCFLPQGVTILLIFTIYLKVTSTCRKDVS